MFDTNPVDAFQDLIDSVKPKYKCIKQFNTINVDDIATVDIKINAIHNTICVTSKRHSYYINAGTLDKHFTKEVSQ